MFNATKSFIQYLIDKSLKIDDKIYELAQSCEQDYMMVVSAGAAKNRKRWQLLLKSSTVGNARLFGYDESTDCRTAALINGFNAHSLELDDGHRFAMIHLGASIISAVKAVTDITRVDDANFKLGIIMGYEAACRISIAMQPSHKNKGFHSAGTCGTVGAAIGAAFCLGMNEKQLERVLTCALGSASGMLEIQEQSSELKPFNVGRAAMDGVSAAFVGLTDYEIPDDMLGGERGFLRTFSDSFDIEALIEHKDYFEIQRIYVKPYASCRHSHSAVEAAIELHKRVNCNDIKEVMVETYKLGVRGHDHNEILGIASAKLSTPYAVAAALLYGRADLLIFEKLDERVLQLAKKIHIVENCDLTKECPDKRIAIVKVRLRDGTEEIKRVDYAKGEPENPMLPEDLDAKKRQLEEYVDYLKEREK